MDDFSLVTSGFPLILSHPSPATRALADDMAGLVAQDPASLIVAFLPKLPDAAARDNAEAELLDACRYTGP